jgi:hypothetical protein
MKWLVAFAFILILGSLFSAFLQMLKRGGDRKKMVTALTWRVGFSVALFLALVIAGALGLIHGNGNL